VGSKILQKLDVALTFALFVSPSPWDGEARSLEPSVNGFEGRFGRKPIRRRRIRRVDSSDQGRGRLPAEVDAEELARPETRGHRLPAFDRPVDDPFRQGEGLANHRIFGSARFH